MVDKVNQDLQGGLGRSAPGNLLARFGDEYLDYQTRTPPLVPNVTRFSGFSDLRVFLRAEYERLDRKKSWFMERHSLRMNLLVTALILVRLFLTNY